MSDKEILDGIARIERLLSTLVKLQAGQVLDREMKDDFALKLWPLTGKAKRNDIMKKLKCAPNTIAAKWSRWEQLGLIVRHGNTCRKIDL